MRSLRCADDRAVTKQPDASGIRRWHRIVFTLSLLAVLLIGGVAIVTRGSPPPRFCAADALLAPNGQSYARDYDKGCKFVDEHGNVVAGQAR